MPLWIEVEGPDPGSFCKTGRGIALGDPIGNALKAYGKGKMNDKVVIEDSETLTFKWGEEDTDVFFLMTKDKRIKKINVGHEG